MAHIAGLYTGSDGDPTADALWAALTRRLGAPGASASAGRLRAAVFPQHAGERCVPPGGAAKPGGVALGFGGDSTGRPPEALTPPWLLCRYDAARRTAIVTTDRHGFALVYVRRIGDCTMFSTSAAALGRLPPAPAADPTAIADMLAFDHLLGERTYRIGVSAVPAGFDLEVGPAGIVFRRRFRYTDIPLSRSEDRASAASALLLPWREAVASTLRGRVEQGPLLVPLDGGLETRLLTASATEAGAAVETFTFGSDGVSGAPRRYAEDVAIAREVTGALGVPWRDLPLEHDWAEVHARRAAELTDGHLDLLHAFGVSLTDAFPPGRLRLDGLAGDVVLGGSSLKPQLLAAASRSQCVDALWRARGRLDAPGWQRLLARSARGEMHARARGSLRASLEQELGGGRGLDPRWSDFWVLRNRVRRFTLNGPLLWQACARSTFTFFEPRFLERVLAVPPAARAGAAVQAHFLAGGWPDMAAIPWQKTGRPVARPGPLDGVLQRLRRPVYPPGASSHDFDAELRASPPLRSFLRDTLFDPSSGVGRFGCFDRAAVERLFQDTERGRRGGMAQLGLLASLVLAEQLWSAPA